MVRTNEPPATVGAKNLSSLRWNRRSVRLKGHDYSRAGVYFVTICTHNRACLFGDVVDGQMVPNDAGRAVTECWRAIPEHFPHVELDAFVVMPNHVHGIWVIVGNPARAENTGAKNFSPLPGQRPRGTSRTVGSVVRGFKIGVTKWVRQTYRKNEGDLGHPPVVWQRNYYEHVIRTDDEWNRIRQYIADNPAQWASDPDNPAGQPTGAPSPW